MEDTKKQRPRRRFFRFSLLTLMLATTCVAGYFSGWHWGTQERQQEIADATVFTKIYQVGDLVTPITPNPGKTGAASADFDPLVELIVSTIEHDSWMENGTGNGQIQPFPSNLSLVVSNTGKTHDGITELLQQLRRLRYELPEDFLTTVREAVARKRKPVIPIKVLTQYAIEDARRMGNYFESAVKQLTNVFGKPSGIYQAGEKGFPEWATAQKVAVWNYRDGKLYFALQDCRPQGLALVTGWWEKSFGDLLPMQIAPEAFALAEEP